MKMFVAIAAVLLIAGSLSAAPAFNSSITIHALPEDEGMKDFVKDILGMIDLQNDVPVVIEPKAPGCAYATTTPGGQQYIAVDPACVGPLRSGLGYNWRAVGILSHEVGHLLGGDTTNPGHGPREESKADEWSGWAMFRLGATIEQAETFAASVDVAGSKTHPARAVRVASVARGWSKANTGSNSAPHMHSGDGWWGELMKTKLPWRTE